MTALAWTALAAWVVWTASAVLRNARADVAADNARHETTGYGCEVCE